ncbi:uncharacterized protein BP5553_09903 [Venustampulla echinocandica]|uniref:Uncharacterized protein n=1 Tax=Venustampulla echinocandica TaxID=2656787 RepID=A0A370TB05_9HELO|nr:uncharacterized protein BP5553_09903 [Venustampulla echinocandica]RDL31114.1 hypothetical protein BP5553_09903 [Venustampulla echinocandica]
MAGKQPASNANEGMGSYYNLQENTYLGPVSVEEGTDKEEKFFQELQKYADYQQMLSEKLESDIASGDTSGESSSPNLVSSGNGRLQTPIFIPQQDMGGIRCGWIRAYAPSLQPCGIDQRRFQNFLDILSQQSMSVPYVDAVNIGALDAQSPLELINAAINLSKSTPSVAHTFLTRANTEFLGPRKLYSTIVVFKPEIRSQIIRVDAMQPICQTQHHLANPLIDLLRPAPLILLPNYPPPATFAQNWTPQSNVGASSLWAVGGNSGSRVAGSGGVYHPVPISQQGGMSGNPQIGEMKIRPHTLYVMIANDTTKGNYGRDEITEQQGFHGPVLFL